MDLKKDSQCKSSEKFKFNDHFMHKFDKMSKAYDDKLKELRSIEKKIGDISHGVCNTGYRVRFITPTDISTFVSNLDKSLASGMLKPTTGDINMFAVVSAKKFIEANGCPAFEITSDMGNKKGVLPNGADLGDLEMLVGDEVYKREVYTKHEMSQRAKYIKEDAKKLDNMHFTAATRSLISKLPTIIEKHSETACCCDDLKSKEMLALYVCNFIMFALKLNLMSIEQMIQYAVPKVTFDSTVGDPKITDYTISGFMEMYAADGLGEVIQESDTPHIFAGMVMECFHDTKVGAEIRSIIPFNCNFRDIALSDDHEFYKNTACALEYITTNPASPFHQLLVKYTPEMCPKVTATEVDSLMRMMFGERLHSPEGWDNPYYRPDVQFPSDPNWMDKITYGNAYYDMNYRRDNPGNHNSDPITTKFDMIHKMYGHCHCETDSTKLAANVRKIVSIMEAIIGERKVHNEWKMPRTLSTEFLAFFGDILTKTLLKLYHLNTTVITYGDDMDDTMIPGYMYNESEYFTTEDGDVVMQESYVIQEADTPSSDGTKPMEVKSAGSDNLKGPEKGKYNMSKAFDKIKEWFIKIIGSVFSNWEKAQGKLLDWVKKNDALIKKIDDAVAAKTFQLTISNYIKYNVQMGKLSAIDPTADVNKAIEDALQNKDSQYGEIGKAQELALLFYPEEIREAIRSTYTNPTDNSNASSATADSKTIEGRSTIVKNFVLYGITKKEEQPQQIASKPLESGMVIEIAKNLTDTKDGIAPEFSKLIERAKAINSNISSKLGTAEKAAFEAAQKAANAKTNADSSNNGEGANQAEAAKKLAEEAAEANKAMVNIAKACSDAEKVLYGASLDAIVGNPKSNKDFEAYRNSFWGRNYQLLRSIVSEYKARGGKAEGDTTTETTTPTTTQTAVPAS